MKPPSCIPRRTLVSRVEQALESQFRAAGSPSSSNATTRTRSTIRTTRTILPQKPHSTTTHRRTFANKAPLHNNNRRQAGDDPTFTSIVDNPPELVRAGGRRHGPGLIVLAIIPLTAFALGSWQVQRLGWKTELIARFEDRLVRDPLPLPPRVDPDAIHDFDYRRVVARGRFRHDREMLVGPRMHDGEQGFMVVTPLERDGGEGQGQGQGQGTTTVLVNRGWISKKMRDQQVRARARAQGGEEALPTDEVVVEGLLREPWKKNMFTPDNRPDINEFYFPDVRQMAELSGSQAVWVEQTMGELFLFSFFVDFLLLGYLSERA